MTEFSTAILCTTHLGLGFIAALWIARARENRHALQLLPVIQDFGTAYHQAEAALDSLPEQLQARALKLRSAVDTLAGNLSRGTSRSPQPVASHAAPPAAHMQPTAQQFEDAARADNARQLEEDETTRDAKPSTPAGGREVERRYYPNEEYMALLADARDSGEPVAIERFERVTCHDLSSTGISFYLDRPLDCEQLIVITLGGPSETVFMAAKVIYARFMIVRGEERYRVGCRFIRRLRGNEEAWRAQLQVK